MSTNSGKQFKHGGAKGFSKNPFFYFGTVSMVLFSMLSFGTHSLAQLSSFKGSDTVFLSVQNPSNDIGDADNVFFSKSNQVVHETPDLKIQDNFIAGSSTPNVTSTQTLGSLFGEDAAQQGRTETIDHVVEDRDTVAALAIKYGISEETIRGANGLSKSSQLKVGENLVIPPANGVLYVIKSGDTLGGIAVRYASSLEKIIAFNGLKDENDIFIEDVLFLPDGKVPAKAAPLIVTAPVANTFFINPTQGKISQRGHGVGGRAVDIANTCGTPVYAAAAGVVQRAQFNKWYGNFVTIAHSGNISTYSGHLQTLEVAPGETVGVGQRIGLMGKTGTESTGCHLHFEVRGAKNFLASLVRYTPVTFK